MAQELDREPDPDYATRTGEFAMLLYSIGMICLRSLCHALMIVPRSRCYRGHRPSSSGKS